MTETPDDLIFSYTRADALADGVLIDVTEKAKEAGWKFPVAINDNAWGLIVPDDLVKAKFGCDTDGRLWDVLWMAMLQARNTVGDTIMFEVIMPQTIADSPTRIVKLKALCHPGDTAAPVVTIMRPEDD